jgi:hypothetical protein
MNRDISTLLTQAMARGWSEADAAALLADARASLPGITVDWDQGAGEYWARCIRDGRVVAFVGMKWPLVILLASAGDAPDAWRGSVEVLLVEAMDASTLRADSEVLRQFAVRQPQSSAFNPKAFSAEDLVWLSV